MYYRDRQYKESNHIAGKLFLGVVALIIGVSAGLYVAVRTIQLPTNQTIYMTGQK
jgi:hypothetical protein